MARRTESALKTGVFFRTSGPPIEIPAASLVLNPALCTDARIRVDHPAGIWLREPVREMTIIAEQYDFAATLLLLEDRDHYMSLESEPEDDTYDRITKNLQLSFDS